MVRYREVPRAHCACLGEVEPQGRRQESTLSSYAEHHRMSRSDSAVVAGVGVTTALNAIRVYTRRRSLSRASYGISIAAIVVHIFQVKGMNVSGEVPVKNPYS